MAKATNVQKELREAIREIALQIISEKKKKKKRSKPGGPDTDIEHLKHVHPEAWRNEVSTAIRKAQGNVKDTADELGVSQGTVYNILRDHESFQAVKSKAEREAELNSKSKKS